MKTVANLFAQTSAHLGSDSQKDRDFITLERLAPDEDGYCSFVKRVASIAQNEYWIAREKNILMLLKRTPHVVRLRKEEKNNTSYQIIKTKDAGISLAHWLRTKPRLANSHQTIEHPFIYVEAFLQLATGTLTALKDIHEAGVIHSQLRPDNICLSYSPYPYHFDTALNINFSHVTLIDFMFSVSSTLKLSRHLPITISHTASTQSTLLKHALQADQQKRQADAIQCIDYSVDLYALGFILQQIFEQNLIYPDGLEPQLSMGIHQLITQLLSFDEGIPASVKLHHLHLLPHDDYVQQITQLLQVAQQNQEIASVSLLFEPAQFLETGSVFHLETPVIDLDALATIEPVSQSSPLIVDANNNPDNNSIALAAKGAAPMTNSHEPNHNKTSTSDTTVNNTQDAPPIVLLKSATSPQDPPKNAPVEFNKWLVIAIIVSLQLSYIWYSTDLTGHTKTDAIATDPMATTKPAIEEVIPEEPMVSTAEPLEEVVPTDTPNDDAAVANIELLSEASRVKTPEIAATQTKTDKKNKIVDSEHTDSVLLSGSPVSDTKTKKVKVVAKKETQGQTAIPLTKEQAQAAEKNPPVAIDVEQAAAISANNVKEKAEAAANESTAQSEKPSPKSLTRGLAEAQNTMGWHYYHGDGVAKNYEESFKWFQKAANLGEPSAQFNVGMMYASGTGIKQDLTEAAKWYKKAAEQGKSSAQLNLGMMYISGRGIRQNIDEGKKWLAKAAEQGDVTAKANLTWLTQQGYIKDNTAANAETQANE